MPEARDFYRTDDRIRETRDRIEQLEAELRTERDELPRLMLQAQETGASIAELQERSGLKRRQVLNLLAAARDAK